MSRFLPWKIVHFDLSQPLPDLPLASGYQGIYTVFWWHDLPLGHRDVLATQLPMPNTQLRNLALQTIVPAVGDRLLEHGFKAPLPVLPHQQRRDTSPSLEQLMALKRPLSTLQAEASTAADGTVSVIICTRNRPEQLADCLRSLQHLSTQPSEIIVVDNAPSSEATQQLVASMPNVRYVLEPRPGLSIARNAGIQHSTGDIIAFTDDDVMVHPSWIAQLQRSFTDPQVMSVTGLILPGALDTEAQVIFEKELGGFSQGYRAKLFDSAFFTKMKSRGVPVWRIGAGANMAFRRKAFDLIGNFDERLGAGASGCSEDSELWYRLLAQGWSCRYDPSVVVYHYHRSDLSTLQHQAYQYMRGHVAALLTQFSQHKHWGNMRRLCIALPRYYMKRSLQHVSRKSQSFNKTLSAEVLGYFAGIKFYLQHR
jgi:glycosyltransferase involved in cell wall biosynthesis